MRPPISRRRAVAGLALAWLLPSLAQAQDPRAALVQRAAREFVALADALDAAASHAAAGKRFRDAMTVARWGDALTKARAPLGAVQQRALTVTRFERSFRGLPDGDYAVIEFRAAFAAKSGVREVVNLEREADGTWRVIGYFLA